MSNLKIALQKSGRLSDKSLNLIKECGISVDITSRKLKVYAENFPIEIFFLRDDDIPKYVEQGVVDVGILGENEVLEKKARVKTVKKLGFAKCRMSLAVPKAVDYIDIQHFQNKKIATSYPEILQEFLAAENISAEIEEISGSVELSPAIGLADAVFDIVSSGETLQSNGLKEVEMVMKSEAVLISNTALQPEIQEILDRLLFRIQSVLNAKSNKYILLNAPNSSVEKIIKLLPGMKSPTILPLADGAWSSIHSVMKEETFWEMIDELKSYGAEGILIVPIEKMII